LGTSSIISLFNSIAAIFKAIDCTISLQPR
jgi:hypothetical protein